MKKFIESKLIDDYEVLTDNGWVDILAIHKTVPYKIWELVTTDYNIKCADFHIVFDNNYNEIYVKDLIVGSFVITENGPQQVIKIYEHNSEINMYDLEIESDDKRYFTNGILSHNTSYIRYLTKCVKDKEILFVPPSMTEVLTDPSIIPFLMERKNCILIIEDGEKIISDRNTTGSSVGVSNILNLTDGIMGDCLNIQVIVTFNMERSQIDKAMIRKGRLIAEHKFEALNVEETNKLLKSIGKKQIVTKGMTLAEIYNIDEEEYVSKQQSKIAFK